MNRFNLTLAILMLFMASGFADNIDQSAVTQISTGLPDGVTLVHYGVNKNDEVIYVVTYPSGEVAIDMVSENAKEGRRFMRLKYKGLVVDGPCNCSPFVECSRTQIRRLKFKKLKQPEFLKITSASKSLKDFETGIGVER